MGRAARYTIFNIEANEQIRINQEEIGEVKKEECMTKDMVGVCVCVCLCV